MRRLRGAGVTDERKTIHSFRHTVSARLAAASIPEYQIADILGHENESMTTGRYGGGTPPKVKLEALSKLTLPI
jgi:integrase